MDAQMIYQVKIIDGQPTFSAPLSDIIGTIKHGGGLKVLSPIEYHTSQQRRWYRGPCLNGLSEWSGDTVDEWDLRLKALCGASCLKKETIVIESGTVWRLTIRGVGKRGMTQFIENILSIAITNDWPVTPPDVELRK